MEQNYSELLREQPIASVKAILDYALTRIKHLGHEYLNDTNERKYYEKEGKYWQEVALDCRQELELRIKQIFP